MEAKKVTLHQMPEGYLSSHYKLTLGNEYTVRGEIGSCVVIDTDEPGETASVHWSRFVAPNDRTRPKLLCAVGGMPLTRVACGDVIVGGKFCGRTGECQHKTPNAKLTGAARHKQEQEQ